MWVTKKRLNDLLARARQNGFDRGYRMAEMNWKIAMTEWGREVERECLPRVLIEAEEIIRAKTK